MKKLQTIGMRFSLALLCVATQAACNLDLTNPNAPTEEQVLSNSQGLIALGVGVQAQFAQTIDDYVLPSALVTDEWGTKTRALLSYTSLLNTTNFENTFDVVSLPYSRTFQIVKSANTLLNSIGNAGFGPGFTAGISANTKLFKAMALGFAAQIYEKVPVNIDVAGAVPQPRAAVMDTVLALLTSARADIANVTDADLAGFRTQVLGTNFDLRNTIDAMIARYSLFRGLYQQANDAAARVNPAVLSSLTYPAPTINPVYSLVYGLLYIGGLRSFVIQAEPGDKRPDYWLKSTVAFAGNPPDTILVDFRKYQLENDAFPIYLPDEMKLIRAEAQARLGNLSAAINLINQVRTQASSVVDEPAANLPALTAGQLPDLTSVLRQIAYERRYELYGQGLRWEDTRRLGSQGNTVTFAFLPLPAAECRTNPNAACQ